MPEPVRRLPLWQDVLDRTVEYTFLLRAQKNRNIRAFGVEIPKVGDKFTFKDGKLIKKEKLAKVILVDFRNRRRVIE